jgi:FkbM family methyltransferase
MEKDEIYATLNEAYFAENCHERELLEDLPHLIAKARFFVDVGASLGQYTRAASRTMRGGRVLAIEADPVRHEELERNAVRWASETGCRIDALFAAAGDRPGEASFFTTYSNVSGALFSRGDEWKEIRVPAVTLDEVCGTEVPDFIKADVEGAELRMLKGASRILAARRTVFLLELHPWDDPDAPGTESVTAHMRSHGYHPVAYFAHTLFLPLGPAYLRERAASDWRRLRARLRRRAAQNQ